ncbi:MAG: shikimate kinase [Sphingobacteriales bacterium]|nr:shikimate kinase [Sphingobacteriales bacterium]
MRYFLIGFMGTGKSYWGRLWAEANDLLFYDLDEEIEKSEGIKISQIFDSKGEAYFRKKEKEVLYSFFKKDKYILSCGGGTPCFFDNMDKMNQNGITIFLKTNIDELVKRLSLEKETRPLIKGLTDHTLKDYIGEKLNDRELFYQKAVYHFNTAYLSNDNFKKIIRQYA